MNATIEDRTTRGGTELKVLRICCIVLFLCVVWLVFKVVQSDHHWKQVYIQAVNHPLK